MPDVRRHNVVTKTRF